MLRILFAFQDPNIYVVSQSANEAGWWTILSPILTALVASGVTLLGIRLQNNATSKRQTREIEAKAVEQRTEREMLLRREIYLDCIAALANQGHYITSFTDLNMPEDQRERLREGTTVALNKLHLIGKLELIKVVDRHQYALSSWRKKLRDNSAKLEAANRARQTAKHGLTSIDEQIANASNAMGGLIGLAEQSGQMQAFLTLHEKLVDNRNNLMSQLDKIQNAYRKIATEMFSDVTQAAIELDELASLAILDLRMDLGFPVDSEQFMEFNRSTHSRALDQLDAARKMN